MRINMHRNMRLASAMVCLALASAAQAASITYNVNEIIGGGTVAGTIQTDGNSGVLGVMDFQNWNLTLSDGSVTAVLNPGNSSVFMGGADVTATPTALYFDFSGTAAADQGYGDYLLFETSFGGGAHYWCNSAEASRLCYQGRTVVPGDFSSLVNLADSGNQVIGLAPAVPEPGTASLILAGLAALGMGAARRRI